MNEPVYERDETGDVREDFIPFLEHLVGRENDWLILIAPGDDLVQEVCMLARSGKITKFVNQ